MVNQKGFSEESEKLRIKLKVHKKYIEELTDENRLLKDEVARLRPNANQIQIIGNTERMLTDQARNLLRGEKTKKRLRRASSSRISKN